MPQSFAFTITADGYPNVLLSECDIEPAGSTQGQRNTFQAIWDTGATHSSITQEVVDKCGLRPIARTKVFHAGVSDDPDETDVYFVNIGLPNLVLVREVKVSRLGFAGGDVLIGMNVINMGDFAITHANDQTKFTFQIPPQADIDFVVA